MFQMCLFSRRNTSLTWLVGTQFETFPQAPNYIFQKSFKLQYPNQKPIYFSGTVCQKKPMFISLRKSPGCARVQIRDATFLGLVYEWLATGTVLAALADDLPRRGILASSLAKLGVAGQLEVRELGIKQRQEMAVDGENQIPNQIPNISKHMMVRSQT